MVLTSSVASKFSSISSRSLVACNIYVSAGRTQHAKTLLSILSESQEQCRILRSKSCNKNNLISEVAVIHAFSDGPYDRSSFHIAGYANSVAHVASFLATKAMRSLYDLNHEVNSNGLGNEYDTTSSNDTLHPYVGVVDHISVMPLLNPPSDIMNFLEQEQCTYKEIHAGSLLKQKRASAVSSQTTFIPSTPHGQAAYAIGQIMSAEPLKDGHFHPNASSNIQVHYYGSADPESIPLAQVRKQKTSFFKSGGLDEKESSSSVAGTESLRRYPYGTATVGAPDTFVENFNVRLEAGIPRSAAIQLARLIREIDGPGGKQSNSGLLGVEVLTLPYSKGRFEVACNLKYPKRKGGSSEAILYVTEDWKKKQQQVYNDSNIVECAYRVGTTEEICWNVLFLKWRKSILNVDNMKGEALMKRHDNDIADRLAKFLS